MKSLGKNIYFTDKELSIIYNSLPILKEGTACEILAKTYCLEISEFLNIINKIKMKILKGR